MENGHVHDQQFQTKNAIPANGWGSPGRSAFDFRSDVRTTPTTQMLAAIARATLGDDDFQEDTTTLSLESWIAKLTGKEASIIVVSGTMGNQISIRTPLQSPPHSVMADARAHILTHEAGGVASLCGTMTVVIEPSNGKYLRLEDIQKKATVRVTHVTDCPTRLIALENTLGGVIMPLSECQRITRWARENGITMHLDGARLWEAVAAGAGSLEEFCACFDSVGLCFSKGLGAPLGSVIVGTRAFRERARWVRKSVRGGLRQAGILCAAARVGVEDTFLGGKLKHSHVRAKEVAAMQERLGGRLVYPVEINMVWLDLNAAGIPEVHFIKQGEKLGLLIMGSRLVVQCTIRSAMTLFRDWVH